MMMATKEQSSARLHFAALFFLALELIASQDSSESSNVLALHSELEDDQDVFYSQDLADESDESVFWLVHEARMLKGGRSRSGRRSTGNCYGDRCDNIGGDAESAMIVGIVIGGCCFCLLCYMLVKWI